MKYQLTLILCLSPIVIIYIVMKLGCVDVSQSTRNLTMSEKNPLENEDPIWKTRMQMLMKRKKSMEIEQTIDDALYQYYTVERGRRCPNWRYIKTRMVD